MNRQQGAQFLKRHFAEHSHGLTDSARLTWLLERTDMYLGRFVGLFQSLLERGNENEKDLLDRIRNDDELYMWVYVAADLATSFSAKEHIGLEYDPNWNEFFERLSDLPRSKTLSGLTQLHELQTMLNPVLARWCPPNNT